MRQLRIYHFDISTHGNYGDNLLFTMVRNTFEAFAGGRAFRVVGSAPLRARPSRKTIDVINAEADLVVVGGGGLFLRDTAPNATSGWQWNIGLQQLEDIDVPLALFAVGNNRFPGQEDFAPIFREHLARTVDKSVFVGLRNHGSMHTIRPYLADDLAAKITYQPCPTTLANRVYAGLEVPDLSERTIATQLIVGKRQARAGMEAEVINEKTVEALGALKKSGWQVVSTPFARADLGFSQLLLDRGIAEREIRLYGRCSHLYDGLRLFGEIPYIFASRGHAQMVPFGVGAFPFSVNIHHKLGYFATDIEHPAWVLDPTRPDYVDAVHATVEEAWENRDQHARVLRGVQDRLLATTEENLADIYRAVAGEEPDDGGIRPFTRREQVYIDQLWKGSWRAPDQLPCLGGADAPPPPAVEATTPVRRRLGQMLRWRRRSEDSHAATAPRGGTGPRPVRLFHFDDPANASHTDSVLSPAVRAAFEAHGGGEAFTIVGTAPIHREPARGLIGHVNANVDAVVVSGEFLATAPDGGLAPHWALSLDQVRALKVPLVLFGVGRAPADGSHRAQQWSRVMDKAVFVGVQDEDLLASLRDSLPPARAAKLAYQPSPTALLRRLYGGWARGPRDARTLAVQVDLAGLAGGLGLAEQDLAARLAEALAGLAADGWTLINAPLGDADLPFARRLEAQGVATTTRLFGRASSLFDGLHVFADAPYLLGSDPRALDIAFGAGAVPVQLASGQPGHRPGVVRPDWVVDLRDADLPAALRRALAAADSTANADWLAAAQDQALATTRENLGAIHGRLAGAEARDTSFLPLTSMEQDYVERLWRQSWHLLQDQDAARAGSPAF